MKQNQLAALIAAIAVIGIVAYLVMSMPSMPASESPTVSTTTGAAPQAPAAGTKKPVSSGTKPSAPTAPAATTSAPAEAAESARLTVASKYPDINYTPPTAVITLTVAASAENQKGAYTVAYGDGTSGLFQLLGKSGTTETWGANDHTYGVPGTYTVTAMRDGKVIATATAVVTTVQITQN